MKVEDKGDILRSWITKKVLECLKRVVGKRTDEYGECIKNRYSKLVNFYSVLLTCVKILSLKQKYHHAWTHAKKKKYTNCERKDGKLVKTILNH